MASTESIRELAEPVLASAGLELWDVEITGDVVRIMVERPGGVDLDTLSAASSVLSPLLDSHPEATPDNRYELEVSSPGIERTLRTPEQYRRYLDAEIVVKTSVPVSGARRHRGRLTGVGPDGINLEPTESTGASIPIRYDQIQRARTVLVWGPTAGQVRGHNRGSSRSAADRAAAALNPKDAPK
jgi:ribosome maturation factor RimP